jgi:hypothetical protein
MKHATFFLNQTQYDWLAATQLLAQERCSQTGVATDPSTSRQAKCPRLVDWQSRRFVGAVTKVPGYWV